ncbi:DegV family protein [Ornithinibacillus contaminans]|uniref:DegV family protein n=1 Tax=Ornithinibacillus contaminans TaxID=694055 RepID=UPI00064DE86C|nr:DegV family protein [Ornithinibacillus contaminans]
MVQKIAFVTDSTAYITEELKAHSDVYVVPIVVISDGEAYEDGVDLTSEQLYEIIRTEKEVPKTSQPNVERFKTLYNELKKNYDAIISIHVSSKLSGTLSSSIAGSDQAEAQVEVVDSRSISYAITILLEKGLKLAAQQVDGKLIANDLRAAANDHQNLILLDTLEQLYKGGRMSGTQFLLGNFLHIKPILSIGKNGELGVVERIRSEKKATRRMITLIKNAYEENAVAKIGIMHANALEKALAIQEILTAELPGLEIVIGEVSSSLAVHAGEGAIAIFWSV